MRRTSIVLSCLVILGLACVHAHPGIGVVRDSRGNIFYTDLKQVWKIAPDGTRSIAVRDVHTHELRIDRDDNLFGEHLWYTAGAPNPWSHRVWQRSPDGRVRDIIPARTGFREDHRDFFFEADSTGAMYWADRGETTSIRKRTPDGRIVTITSGGFRNVRNMTVSPDGIIHLIDLHDLVRIDPDGTRRTVARGLADQGIGGGGEPDAHAVMGLWSGQNGDIFAAVALRGVVKKISSDGRTQVVDRSVPPWSPSGGLLAPNGDLWVLEFAPNNDVRVRQIRGDGRNSVYE